MLQVVNKQNLEAEEEILFLLYQLIDSKESFCFNAGAGAGKTYALISSLEHILKKHGDELIARNESVLCITYTNVAKQEIEERLGKNDQVIVSTIHELIWQTIKIQQPLLLKIHQKKIETSLEEIEQFFLEGKEADVYRSFSLENKKKFEEVMLEKADIYYDCYDFKALVFKEIFLQELTEFNEQILSSNSKFKKVVDSIYKRSKLNNALDKMKRKSKGFDKVVYTPKNNRDSLHRLRISHNTLLEYGKVLFESKALLRKFFIDKYPIVLVDEYQDTDTKVVELLNVISSYAQSMALGFVVGYFGDTVQNIYETGVGGNFYEMQLDLNEVNKKFNRRSTQEIIKVINKIRNDHILQESIYEDDTGGSVEIIEVLSKDSLFTIIEDNYKKYHHPGKKDFATLFLKNEDIVNLKGFSNLYTCLAAMPIYSGGNYTQITTEVLSNNVENLGYFQRTLRNLIEFTESIVLDETPLNQIRTYLTDEDRILNHQDFNFNTLFELRKIVKENTGKSLESYLEYLLNQKEQNTLLKRALSNIFQMEEVNLKMIKRSARDFFYRTILEDEIVDDNNASLINDLFKVKYEEFSNWYYYLIGDLSESVNYLTLHGSKGLEFEHVIVVIGDKFSRRKDYFSLYFEDPNGENIADEKTYQWQQARNLFYVACSRAKINLTIVLLGDEISSQKSRAGIEQIVGKSIKSLSIENTD